MGIDTIGARREIWDWPHPPAVPRVVDWVAVVEVPEGASPDEWLLIGEANGWIPAERLIARHVREVLAGGLRRIKELGEPQTWPELGWTERAAQVGGLVFEFIEDGWSRGDIEAWRSGCLDVAGWIEPHPLAGNPNERAYRATSARTYRMRIVQRRRRSGTDPS